MNKKIVTCLLSFFSMALFCAEDMEIVSDNFSFANIKEALDEIEGSSISQEEMEQETKERSWLLSLINENEFNCFVQERKRVNSNLIALRERITEFENELGVQLRDENNILKFAKVLQTSGQEKRGNELEKLWVNINYFEFRKEQNLNGLIEKIFADSQNFLQ